MSLRVSSAVTLAAALLISFLALIYWRPASAFASLAFALAGACVALLLTRGAAGQSSGDGATSTQTSTTRTAEGAESAAEGAAAESVSAGELVETMLDSMREGMLVVDEDLNVVASNTAARVLFGFGRGGTAAAGHRPRLGELTRNPAVLSAYLDAIERGERVEVKVAMEDAERRVFDLRVAPLRQRRGAGLPGAAARGAVGVFFDITRLERLERVRQEFLSNVSHELRTPLTAIRAFVETLESGALEDADNNRRFLSIIDRNAARMHSLIDDILELSAIEAGTATVEARPVRLRSMINEVLTALAARAAERGVMLRNEVSEDVFVHADARRLEQMLTNLCDNAVKFSAEGGAVSITHERAGGRDRISVADTGEGIAPAHIHRIFERFYRVDRARSRALGGTGLGLAIVKHLARAHGGEATVRSTPGEGSTFTIELPHSVNADH
ncbi:MAG: two-component system, OmpR family, phosphate regulon sensor histidine kinase PhoR [Pyrinomonadaceae bacterium]|jgi:two-component system phosphate regulon sensor histidine kinase PhoR|nr:two-component system, OmpR family, phosphate regulon sensor histidine kinase PhoR [Pyrinomonadaceae bacterium]